MLSYETTKMTRDDIVNSTYESAQLLNEFKLKYKLIDLETYEDVKGKILASIHYIEKIDQIITLPEAEKHLRLLK